MRISNNLPFIIYCKSVVNAFLFSLVSHASIHCKTNNNLPLIIYCKNIVDTFLSSVCYEIRCKTKNILKTKHVS